MRSVLFCLLLAWPAVLRAQEPVPTLAEFFRQFLATDALPPVFDVLLAVADSIADADPKGITAALPLIDAALASAKEDLPAEGLYRCW